MLLLLPTERLGGDEFALLLPETNQESARVTLSNLRDALMEEMRRGNWPITFSIGVVTCTGVIKKSPVQ